MSGYHLYEKYSFQARTDAADDYGNTVSDWAEQFSTRGRREFFKGIEKVRDAASSGQQKAIVTVRNFSDSRAVTTGWRLVDKRSGETYNVVALEPQTDRQYIEFIVESGGPDG